MRPLGVYLCSAAVVSAVITVGAPRVALAEGGSEAKSCAVAKKPLLESLFERRGKVAKAQAKPPARPKPAKSFEQVSAPLEAAVAAAPPASSLDAAVVQVSDEVVSSEPVPGDEPSLGEPAAHDDEQPLDAEGEQPSIGSVEAASDAVEANADNEAVEANADNEAVQPKAEASSPGAAAVLHQPAAAPDAEEAPVVVTGAVVLGLLRYTIAQGAFGLGTTVGLDAYSADASVGFGPTAALGLTDWLTLGAAVPFASSPSEGERITGLGNVGVSAQFGYFNDAASGIALAATPGISLPSPSAAASSDVSPDLKASGAVNLGAVALNLTARGAVKVPTVQDEEAEAVPVFDSALSLILVNDTIAPFLEGGVSVSDELVPMGAAGLNWAPGGGALLTLGIPVAFHESEVKPGMSFTAYFETDLFGRKPGVAKTTATAIAKAH